MVAIVSTPIRDLYVVFCGDESLDTNRPVLHAYLNPLVKWIWFRRRHRRAGHGFFGNASPIAGWPSCCVLRTLAQVPRLC